MTETPPTVINARPRDLGGAPVRRLLPSAERRSVGPFVFFDHLGPVDFAPGHGVDVRPHPHIGLATVTWLFAGALDHRDSVGTVQTIRPGAVNWMTAGRGIVHSERTPGAERAAGSSLEAIQTWVALPASHEEAPPAFDHFPAAALPVIREDGLSGTLIAGAAWGQASPVRFPSPILQAALATEREASISLPAAAERALYVAAGRAQIGGLNLEAGDFALLDEHHQRLSLASGARAMLVGGDALDGPRRLDWNFVASTQDMIVRARDDWRASIAGGFTGGRFGLPPGEASWIPYPGDPQPDPPDTPPV